jgi:hypothetical protein
MCVNEVSRVRTTIDRVAKGLGEDVTSSSTSAPKWSPRTASWVLSLGDESVITFAD